MPTCHKVFVFIYKSGVKNKLQIAPNKYPYDYDVSRYDKEVAGLCLAFLKSSLEKPGTYMHDGTGSGRCEGAKNTES